MRIIKLALTACCMMILCGESYSQRQWTLSECIEYALKNNLTVKKAKIQSLQNEVQLSTARNSRLPNVSAGVDGNFSFGRSLTADNSYQDVNTFSSSVGLNANMPLFNGFQIKHSIQSSKLDLLASVADIERLCEDISMNITTYYLQVLYSREMVAVGESQVALSQELVGQNKARFVVGKIPESTLFESLSQLAKDEFGLIEYQSNLKTAILDLMQSLNLDRSTAFDIEIPKNLEVSADVLDGLWSVDKIYAQAVEERPRILAEKLRLESSEQQLLYAKGARYPQVSLGAGYNTGYYHSFQYANKTFSSQFKNNATTNIGLNVSIPIFSRNQIRNKIRTAEFNIKTQTLTIDEAKLVLRKEIEQASQQANTSYLKYVSALKSMDVSAAVFKNEQEKINVGKSTLFDYNNAKTQLTLTQSEVLQAKYDFIFRCKVVSFYLGEPLNFD